MRSYFLSILIMGSSVLFSRGQIVVQSELLGRPTGTSIDLQMIFSDTVDLYVEYGTESGIYPLQSSLLTVTPLEPAELSLTGLLPNTKYYYRFQWRLTGTGEFSSRPEFTFHTQRSKGSPFTFVVQADPHLDSQTDTAIYRRCLQNQLEDNPDFMIDLGDFLMTDKLINASNQVPYDTIPYRCNLLRSYYNNTCHSVPLYIALGNHEGEAGWYLNSLSNTIAIWNAQERLKYFMNPFPNSFYTGDTSNNNYIGIRENYYAWTWGDALFIILDPYWYTNPKPDSLNGWRWTLGKTQYDWLKTTLENNSSPFKFVFAHQIIGGDPEGRGGIEFADRYEWGGENLDGTAGFAVHRPGWYKPIKDLLTENKVTIFFHGHDHFFAKQEKDCLIYQETPQPGHPNFSNAQQAATYGYVSGQLLPSSGHLRVSVNSGEVKVDYVRAYKASDETPNRQNKDVSATYFIDASNCYDSLSSRSPVLWNRQYVDELVYPNPFSHETKIEFTTNQKEKLSLLIFNERGQIVRNLMEDKLVQQGKFQIIWDGKDGNGNLLPSGTYFYHINRNGKISSHRIQLLTN